MLLAIKNTFRRRRSFASRSFFTDFTGVLNNPGDFHKQELTFDLEKLQEATSEVLKIHGNSFDDSLGIKHFAAIPLTRIPGDPDSIKGHKARGLFWTKPDSTGVEVSRDIEIKEELYTEVVPKYKHTYFSKVITELQKQYKLGRVRLLLKEPRSCLSFHRDPEPRLHIPIITNPGAQMIIEDKAFHMPADGGVWVTNNEKYHNFVNGGEEGRVHLVAGVLNYTEFE